MTEGNTEPEVPEVHPEIRDAVVELGIEAAYMPKDLRAVQDEAALEIIGEIAGDDLKLRETLVGMYDAEINKAEEIARRIAGAVVGKGFESEQKTVPVEVDFNKIGWLGDKKAFSNYSTPDIHVIDAERIEQGDLVYDLADLTGFNKHTNRLIEELDRQGIKSALLEELKDRGIPNMWMGVLAGRGIRPVSIGGMSARDRVSGGRHTNLLLTRYPAYKVDVQGTKNRALVLVLGRDGDIPRFGLAAMYDHDDDWIIHRHLYSNPQ